MNYYITYCIAGYIIWKDRSFYFV